MAVGWAFDFRLISFVTPFTPGKKHTESCAAER